MWSVSELTRIILLYDTLQSGTKKSTWPSIVLPWVQLRNAVLTATKTDLKNPFPDAVYLSTPGNRYRRFGFPRSFETRWKMTIKGNTLPFNFQSSWWADVIYSLYIYSYTYMYTPFYLQLLWTWGFQKCHLKLRDNEWRGEIWKKKN
jgi:hypothetical protein